MSHDLYKFILVIYFNCRVWTMVDGGSWNIGIGSSKACGHGFMWSVW
jgi:hypothetical protein